MLTDCFWGLVGGTVILTLMAEACQAGRNTARRQEEHREEPPIYMEHTHGGDEDDIS